MLVCGRAWAPASLGRMQLFRRGLKAGPPSAKPLNTATRASAAAAMPRPRIIDVPGSGTHERLWFQNRSAPPVARLVFLPGNPGVVAFYEDYLRHLYNLFDGRVSILALGCVRTGPLGNAPPAAIF